LAEKEPSTLSSRIYTVCYHEIQGPENITAHQEGDEYMLGNALHSRHQVDFILKPSTAYSGLVRVILVI
jgi:hypothetical protein